MKKFLVKKSVNSLSNIAKNSLNAACIFAIHQPKEPKSLIKIKKQ